MLCLVSGTEAKAGGPLDFRAQCLKIGAIELQWSAKGVAEQIKEFKIFRSTDNITFEPLVTVPGDKFYYIDTNLLPEKIYYYRITVVTNTGSLGPFSSPESISANSANLLVGGDFEIEPVRKLQPKEYVWAFPYGEKGRLAVVESGRPGSKKCLEMQGDAADPVSRFHSRMFAVQPGNIYKITGWCKGEPYDKLMLGGQILTKDMKKCDSMNVAHFQSTVAEETPDGWGLRKCVPLAMGEDAPFPEDAAWIQLWVIGWNTTLFDDVKLIDKRIERMEKFNVARETDEVNRLLEGLDETGELTLSARELIKKIVDLGKKVTEPPKGISVTDFNKLVGELDTSGQELSKLKGKIKILKLSSD
jgi:hypothetical protein